MTHDHPLSDQDISAWLKKHRLKDFVIVSRDEMLTGQHKVYIINLDRQSGPGTHWTVLMSAPNQFNAIDYIYFDSFGMEPPENVKQFVHEEMGNRYHLYWSSNKLQDDRSVLCGQYVLRIIQHVLIRKQKASAYLARFSPDTRSNDAIVRRWWNGGGSRTGRGCGTKGAGFDLVEKLNRHIPFELHMRRPDGQAYSFLGPNTKLEERLRNHDELAAMDPSDDRWIERIDAKSKAIDAVDHGAMVHDVEYMIGERRLKGKELLAHKHRADHRLQRHAFSAMRDSHNSMWTRILGGLVGSTMWAKRKLGLGIADPQLPITRDTQYLERLIKKWITSEPSNASHVALVRDWLQQHWNQPPR